jgi:hypothetical protein
MVTGVGHLSFKKYAISRFAAVKKSSYLAHIYLLSKFIVMRFPDIALEVHRKEQKPARVVVPVTKPKITAGHFAPFMMQGP